MTTQNKNGMSASARDQLNGIVKEDLTKDRVALHVFDPDASPQQKGAAAGKARDQVKSVTNGKNDSAAKGTPLLVK
jgi:type IV pilus biogenesis protein CpaD/CtpE